MKPGWTEAPLGELCDLAKGTSPTMASEPGPYPLVVTAAFRRTADTFQFTRPAACIPTISSTGHGNAAIHRIHYQEGRFALANLLVAATPKDEARLSAKYLWRYLSAVKDHKLVPLMQGTANVGLKEADLRGVMIEFPPLAEQQRLAARLDAIETRLTRVRQLREEQTQKLQASLRSAFHRIEASSEWLHMSVVAPIIRREIVVDPEGSYPELGIRSFGRGTFHKPNISGLETTKRLFEIHAGDLVFNIVFAWEGAVAVAQPADHGRFGSHRFITCVCDPKRVSAEILAFYFQTPDGIEKLGKASPGGAGRNRTLGVAKLEEMLVPVPQLSAQLEFQKLLALQTQVAARAAESEAAATALLPSLLDQIFNQ